MNSNAEAVSNIDHNPRRKQIVCPLCECKTFKVTYLPTKEVNDPMKLYGAASGIQGAQTMVTCDNCNLLYENPRFDEDDIIAGYASTNEAGHDSQHAMRVESFYKALVSLKKEIPAKGAKILDIGTAGGAFLEAAEKYGYKATGIEPSAYLVEAGKKRGLDIVQGVIQNHRFENQSFDMVCLWDVLEHVTDPKDMLRCIKPLLKPNGVLLINYPDIGTWQAKLAGKRFWWLLSVHLLHFSPKSIRYVAEQTGFRVEKLKPYWQTLEFGYLEHIAAHLGVPLAATIEKLTPSFIKKIPMPYYASQTTALLKVK